MNNQQKNAIIVSLDNNVSEIIQLSETLDYVVVKEFIQQRNLPDVNFYVGSGKLDEIKEFIDGSDEAVDLIIVNGELKPSQWFALEKRLSVDVYDRIRLILAIFEEHAERKEARLQVKLAQLHYERPFVRELIHRARSGEHPGLMAGGEYQVDDYYEMIKKQMKKIRSDLKKIRNDREVHRKTRYKSGFYLVSLVGYTNAGKSSLLNLLSGEDVKVEGRLFSTLSTTTRRILQKTKEKTIPILLTDTVGFIENLPSWIIDAFHSTLEEIEVA
ncbi:MAG: GTPase HflX, partial [Candidatus Thermoplasmatota archaeon]|nr:GTPase HflX [Candidatus Thermoplasmatota archaeon]